MKITKLFIQILFLSLLLSCSPDNSEFYYGNLGAGVPKIIVASQSAGHYSLAMYDENGNFIRILKDYVPEGIVPMGLTAVDSFNFLVATDGGTGVGEKIDLFNIFTGETPFVSSTLFAGDIYHVRRHATLGTFAINSNEIDAFDDSGFNSGNPRIITNIGACTLNDPRSMTFNAAGQLIVVGIGNDVINTYDVTDPLDTVCVNANAVLAGTDPIAVLAHSDGNLYVATQGNDRIYMFNGDGTGAGVVVFNNAGFIDDPTALIEMPDGTIVVASDGTDSLVQITTAGALVGSTYLLSDMFTNSISDMILLQEDQ